MPRALARKVALAVLARDIVEAQIEIRFWPAGAADASARVTLLLENDGDRARIEEDPYSADSRINSLWQN